MKSFFKKLIVALILIVIIAAAVVVLGLYFNKINLNMWKSTPLVEKIPYGQNLEVIEFKEAEFYDSTNEFIGAEIRIKVKFASQIEPKNKLPSEYKRGLKKAYSNVDIYVKDIISLEMLEKMKEALAESRYLKLIEGKEVRAEFYETKINNKKVKSIEKLFVMPDSYYFVKY